MAALLASASGGPLADGQTCGQCPPVSIIRNIGPGDFKLIGTYLYQAHIPADSEYGFITNGSVSAPYMYVDYFRYGNVYENLQVCRQSYSGTTINCNTNNYHHSSNGPQDVGLDLTGIYSVNNSVWDHYLLNVSTITDQNVTWIGSGASLADWS